MKRLENKVAIVTGAGSGIGRGIALKFLAEGAKVVLADWNLENAEQTIKIAKKDDRAAFVLKVDVSQENEMKELIDKTETDFGGLDIMVNNAGIFLADLADQATGESWSRQIEVDLKSVWLGSKYALLEMKKVKKGKIINISSVAALVGFNGSFSYSAAKGGVTAITRQMALDYASFGININAIAPGAIETSMSKPVLNDPEMLKQVLSQIPFGRIGQPEDIANAALFLASDESNYITGQVLVVDGGWTIR